MVVPVAEVPGYNAHAYEDLVAAMDKLKVLELPHIAMMERDQDYPISVIMQGLTSARHQVEGAKDQPDYFLKPDESQLRVPIFSCLMTFLIPSLSRRRIHCKSHWTHMSLGSQ